MFADHDEPKAKTGLSFEEPVARPKAGMQGKENRQKEYSSMLALIASATINQAEIK